MASLAAHPTTFLSDARLPILLLGPAAIDTATGGGDDDGAGGGGLEGGGRWRRASRPGGFSLRKESKQRDN